MSSRPLRVLVLAPDVPYPAHRGGRADVWRRILAMRLCGHEVFLVNLQEPEGPMAPSAADLSHIDARVQGRFSFPIKRGPWRTLRQLALAWHTPWHAATRVPETAEMEALWPQLDAFGPDLIWLEGPWFGRLALTLQRERGWPYAYRSHNVEHRYLRGQARAAAAWRDRVAWTLACIGLRRFEQGLMARAAAVFDISLDDLAFWQRRGLAHGHWLPPLPQAAVEASEAPAEPSDLLFLGNLATPNNIRGVEFLVDEVWPLLRRQVPDAALTLVGSQAAPPLRERLRGADGVRLVLDVPDPMRWLRGARVLVNPVMTGSGVQLKTLDMLMTDAPIVSTPQGARGLPAEAIATLTLAEGPSAFAAALVRARAAVLGPLERDRRAQARRGFGVEAVDAALRTALAR